MARAPGTVHGRQSGRRPRSGLSRRPMAGERSPLASSVADNAMWAKVGSCSRSEWLMPGFARRFGPGQGGPTQDWPKTDFIQFKEVQRSAGSNKPRRMGSTVLTGGVSPRGSGASRCRSRSRPSGAIGRDVAMLPSFRRTSPAALPKAGTPPHTHRTEGSAFSSKFRPIHASAVKPGGRASLLWDNNIVRIRPEVGA